MAFPFLARILIKQKLALSSPPDRPIARYKQNMTTIMEWPSDGLITPGWAKSLAQTLDASSRSGEPPKHLSKVFPKQVHERLMKHTLNLLEAEPTLLRLQPPPDTEVVVVGDTHGQLHDALKLMQIAGEPSETNWYVFNGDFVDRGAWGAELFAVVLAWKAACPEFVFLLRGNHECEFCTEVYGYKRELQVKYSKPSGNVLWRNFMNVGSELPLAAMIGDKTLVLHGGLFRGKKRKGKGRNAKLTVGTLDELASAWKGGGDPDGEGDATIAGDVLWSDPAPESGEGSVVGLIPNENRGIGTMFGPDATSEFLKLNNLSLILRSHEGPDAREDRVGMDPMKNGFSIDHDIAGVGKLCTVFSAPDYPQFIEQGDIRHNNAATFVRLSGKTDWCDPTPTSFTACHPRPVSAPYYDITVGGSDEEGPDGELARETRANGSEDAREEEGDVGNGEVKGVTDDVEPDRSMSSPKNSGEVSENDTTVEIDKNWNPDGSKDSIDPEKDTSNQPTQSPSQRPR